MNDIVYVGERLGPAYFGHAAVVLSFVASLVATIAYAMATQRRADVALADSWRRMGRAAFVLHGLSVFSLIGTVFYVMLNRYFEYHYVYQHVSNDLPMRYILSAFWEGQEGSFMLWQFWHVVLGSILMFRTKDWESPVMATVASVQMFLAIMLLGVHIGGVKIGINPTILFRQAMDIPLFQNQDYLTLLTDGTGLNPLLQNYWNTIHPPVLFLGFASTLVPFAFAVAGLWTGRHREWVTASLPWALFSGAIFGLGILMGGAWAYEALSFGGYWAWDPVENASLVPWLLLVAGIHTAIVAKATGHAIRSTYLFYLMGFAFVIYSTYLTRSGVLQDTSVHAFTEMGLGTQLVIFVLFYMLGSLIFFFAKQKSIPSMEKEESLFSKEFWIFVGSLVLLLSAGLITFTTSIPVFNKIVQLFDPDFSPLAPPADPVAHHNKYQMWIAVFMGLLSAGGQFLRWRERDFSKYAQKAGIHFGVSLVGALALSILAAQFIHISTWQYFLLIFAGLFTFMANGDFLATQARRNWGLAGSAISHLGFGLMIVGILASGLNKRFISTNILAQRGLVSDFTAEDYARNVVLYEDMPLFMSGYEVTYERDSFDRYTRTFELLFKKLDERGAVTDSFRLYPNVLYTKQFDKIAASNPDTRHYAFHDVFTHVASLPLEEMDMEAARKIEDSLDYRNYIVRLGDTFHTQGYIGRLEEIVYRPEHPDYEAQEGDLALGVRLSLFRADKPDKVYTAQPLVVLRGQRVMNLPDKVNALRSRVRVANNLFELVFGGDMSLQYEDADMKVGDSFVLGGRYRISFNGIEKNPEHPLYEAQAGDIAVSALLQVDDLEADTSYVTRPVYLLRAERASNLKTAIEHLGLHFRFNINPATENITLSVAQTAPLRQEAELLIAEDAPPSDFIVLEAIIFPGINFFWAGSLMMLLGLAWAMVRRWRG